MEHYWRLKDMPELRDVPAKDRREWWREAAVRSRTRRDAWLWFFLYVPCYAGALVLADVCGYRAGWPHFVFPVGALALAAWAYDHWLVQPRARRWLRVYLDSGRRNSAH